MKRKELKENPTLKNIREWRGLTQKELAETTGISLRILAYYETKEKEPTISKAAALARALNISLKTLYRSLGISCEGIPDDVPEYRNDD